VGWTALSDHLRGLGYQDEALEASGFCLRTRRGTLVDRFRDRLTLPVHDQDGQVVSFVGRKNPANDERAPKYLNGTVPEPCSLRVHSTRWPSPLALASGKCGADHLPTRRAWSRDQQGAREHADRVVHAARVTPPVGDHPHAVGSQCRQNGP